MSADRYAILQADLELPSVDRLRAAFRSVPFLTDLDAHTLAQDGYGILVKGLNEADTRAVQAALAREGIETERVQERHLPVLPPVKFVHRLDCTPEALLIYNPLGQTVTVEWAHVMMIASGDVRLIEHNPVTTARVVTTWSGRGQPQTEVVRETRRREERNHRLLVEIILTGAVLRFSVNASQFSWAGLGERQTGDTAGNFRLLVGNLLRHAPGAVVNRGSHFIREEVEEVFPYPSKNAFFEEIIWLLWKRSQRAGSGAGPSEGE